MDSQTELNTNGCVALLKAIVTDAFDIVDEPVIKNGKKPKLKVVEIKRVIEFAKRNPNPLLAYYSELFGIDQAILARTLISMGEARLTE